MKNLGIFGFIALAGANALALPLGSGGGPYGDFSTDVNVVSSVNDDDGPPDEEPPVDPRCAQLAGASLSSSAAQVALGQDVTLTWAVQLPEAYCQNAYLTLGGQSIAAEGSLTVSPLYSRYYPLAVNGVQLTNLFIEVKLPGVVHIKGSGGDWKFLLRQAVGTENTTVILAPNIDMDLTGHQDITVVRGVTLTSQAPRVAAASDLAAGASWQLATGQASAAAASFAAAGISPALPTFKLLPDIVPRLSARDARRPGPRLYTRTRARPLFVIPCGIENGDTGTGDNVSINGFRLIGPDINQPIGSDNLDRAIQINGCRHIEIANMELAGWSGQAIYVQDFGDDLAPPGRLTTPSQVYIHDNFFHHNQQKTGGDGYGIEVKHGAYALIERNVFDFNRHAISAGGEDGTGYTARYNLVLTGGGVHNWDGPLFIDYSWYTHQFDVHGTDNCGIGDWFSDSLFNCGQAGEKFEMSRNAFQYTRGYAIKVRGNPTAGATVSQNVFAHGSAGDAVKQNGSGGAGDNITNPIQLSGNQFGVKTAGQYGVCDFDGDKKDDFFLATGASWWMMSGAKQHWVFLNDSTERLEQLGLGDFDGDGRCDVFSVHAYDFGIYKSGTGAWQSLGTYYAPMSQLRFADFNGDGVQDIFRRTPEGEWWIVSPGHYDWEHLGGSSRPLDALRFGDFNGDRIADIIVENGKWSVSWSGRFPWQPLNKNISTGLKKLLIADLDGNGVDDIARFTTDGPVKGKWEVSWNGQSKWLTLAALTWPVKFFPNTQQILNLSSSVQGYVGRFNGAAAANLLSVDYTRLGKIWNPSSPQGFVAYGSFAY